MRNLLFILIASGLISCSSEEKSTLITKISGTVENIGNQKIFLVSKTGIDTLATDSLGSFSIEKNIEQVVISNLRIGKKQIPLYLVNGYDLNLKTTKNDFLNSAILTGKGSKENNLLIEKAKLSADLKYYPSIFKLSPEDFLAKSDSIKTLFNNLADTYAKGKNIDSEFLNTFKNNIKYEQLYYYSIYKPYHNYFMKEELELGEEATIRIKSAVVDNDKLTISKNYIKFISYVKKDKYKKAEIKEDDNPATYLTWLNSELQSPKLKNELYFDGTKNNITYLDDEGRDKLYSVYSKLNTDTIYQKTIDKIYASFEKLRKGKPAAKWSYPDINGKEYALDDFKGKYVYIDVWATWCSPCKAEIPALTELYKEYKNDIVIVSVSVDDNKNAWEKMLKKDNFGWIQIHAEKAWKSDIILKNEIKGIPRFMMVDREGNIVSANAPRPSSEGIREYFNELLKN